MNSTQAHSAPPASTQPTTADWLFMLACVVALAVVAFLGKLAYEEAMKTETAKRNGEAVVAWMQEATAGRFEADYGVTACAGAAPTPAGATPSTDKAAATAAPNTWGGCLDAILMQSTMKALDNPFREGIALDFAPACNTEDHSLAGNIVMEKITATPPGSAIPTIISPLTPEVAIDQKIRVNGVSPGAILWPESELLDTEKQEIVSRIALKRSGQPDDIAKAVLFLVQDANYITGQILSVDGGRTLFC